MLSRVTRFLDRQGVQLVERRQNPCSPANFGARRNRRWSDREAFFSHFTMMRTKLLDRVRDTSRQIQERVRRVLDKWGEESGGGKEPKEDSPRWRPSEAQSERPQ